MAQQTEFIPYEQALELKELGFNEGCLDQYSTNGELWELRVGFIVKNQSLAKASCSSPLYQQAFRWFRDEKLCDGSICRHGEADGSYSYRWDIVYEYGVYEERHFKQGYKTYEEAELACIKQLIEIVKNK